MKPKLTIAQARDLPFEDLIERADALIADYAPGETETQEEKIQRLSCTLDEMPEIYRWLLTLQSWFDHWTDAYADQFGQRSREYKQMRERRDAMERAAKAAKSRYEGASRVVTIVQGFDPTGMPRGRSE